jgi:general stress protein 26
MRQLIRCAAVLAALLPSAAAAQSREDAARQEALAHARAIVEAARYATLSTLGEHGHPQARIVDPFAPDETFTIWVGTNRHTRKVADIGRDERVTLLYFNADAGEYVAVVGKAKLVTDSTERAHRWKSEWSAFYAGGPLGDEYVLIRIEPVRLELVSPARGLMNDPVTWLPVLVEFSTGR